MPELSRFQGMIIKLYFDDSKQHHKPHVHVFYGDQDVSIGLDGQVLVGKLPIKKLTILQAWMILHEDELYAAWNKAIRKEPFEKIAPLR